MKVPRLDVAIEDAGIADEIREAISRVVEGGHFIGGPEVDALETELAVSLGAQYVVTCASGTDALALALRAIHERERQAVDRVVVPALSFSATASAVYRAGLRPVYVDVDPETLLIDWDAAREQADRYGAVAIVPVHLYGRVSACPDDLEAPILADACQAFGAKAVGDNAAFSFFPSKPLGCYGDGGAFACTSIAVVQLARMLALHGSSTKYISDFVGYNSRLDAIQAAILRVKLKYVRERISARARIAHTYKECLGDLDWLRLPHLADNHTWHCFVVRTDADRRERFRLHLRGQGIDAVVQYPMPLHRQPAFSGEKQPDGLFAGATSLPHAEQASTELLGLPIWAGMRESQVLDVIHAVRSFGG